METPESASILQHQSGSDAPTSPQPKRQRISQACTPCRDRKTRCDGRQPVCVACENRGVASICTFDYARRQRAKPSQAPRRPTEVPNRLADPTSAQATSEVPANRPQLLPTGPTAAALYPKPPQRSGIDPGLSPSVPAHGLVHARADGLATIAAGHDESLYGPSSTVAFLRHVMPNQSRHGSVTPVHHVSHGSRELPDARNGSAVPDRLPAKADGVAVLPRRRQADHFLLCFWEFIHPLFPVLHKPSFMLKYERLWVEDDQIQAAHESEAEEAIFTSTLNLVFALGSKFSTQVDPSQKVSVADDFYQRSRQSYPFDILDSTSINLVQILVLTAVYLQSTEHASRCWNSLGLAIRMGQSLGLHVDHGSRKAITQLELEMRRRIWHTCMNLDRLLAMTFGRPSMIDRFTDVPAPALVDDEYLSDRDIGVQPSSVPSRLGLFVSSCQLFDLLEEILELFYRDSSGTSSQKHPNGMTQASELLAPVLDLNRRLDKFVENVPEYLQVPTSGSGTEDHIHLQQQVLYCRFLYVRLLSLRPVLLMSTRRNAKAFTTPMSLDDDLIRSCCTLCTFTACRLIDTLYENLGTLYRSSGWHTVYFTFSAAIVLLASSKVEELGPHVNRPTIEAAWARCWQVLQHYEGQIHSAAHARNILQTMKARMTDSFRRGGDSQRTVAHDNYAVRQDTNGTATAYNNEIYPQISLDDIDLTFSADNMSEAWFGQQLISLDWLEMSQM
ncbi:Sorbicillinoid biosynthetic cluster transcription factor sor3 [Fulvia fulva]|uniref:Sorbicillinoid biosynthetic cluster transcription factor sor3 n=1 Tax=Passalora fulva TaxID=5499 RepID=A0A9Q8PC82_PASFU|nr:Sorbicillinoid biosynthetic cluster transcription factor sor3 [Fulvia fulva]UJO19783.1 Sorbicillinoid biosynthetic cluster transcription factor sor3 [Fulvia fulva]